MTLSILGNWTGHVVRVGPYARSRGIDKRPETVGTLAFVFTWWQGVSFGLEVARWKKWFAKRTRQITVGRYREP